MAIQSTYSETIRAGVPGQLANIGGGPLLSRTVEDAAGIAFGKAVEQGTNDKGCKVFDGGVVLGITVRERSVSAEQDKFLQYESARIAVPGSQVSLWVTAAVAVNAGDDVYVRPSNGDFQKTNANSAVQIPGARWETSTSTTNQIAKVRLG